MITVYLYLIATMADWEIGFVTAELNSKRFFKQDAPSVCIKTVSLTKECVKTMGGLTILPDCTIDEIAVSANSVLILPGADTWGEAENEKIIAKAAELLEKGGTVCAICGATVALANLGLLDSRPHTSNGAGFLEMFCPSYKGTAFYVDDPSVCDGNLITASATGGLLFAKQIIEKLGIFQQNTLEEWYAYFSTGEAWHFFALMQTLPPRKNK
ncbi:MAG: glutamine amidotransferase [Treponema sp.]|nr:glutamine amidotransferase [Treponema sp.]MBR1404660.1 glutamine amidotransferase [Treponema sp.]